MKEVYTLNKKVTEAYNSRNYNDAKEFIDQQIEIAEAYKASWNYSNLIHHSFTYLGLISIKEDDISAAKQHLLASVNVKGSPQLRAFGPNMLLASELLMIEERVIVLDYLATCKKFWMKMFRFRKMKRWIADIKANRFPDFGMHEKIHLEMYKQVEL